MAPDSHRLRELLETMHGLIEILDEESAPPARRDIHRLLEANQQVADLRLAVIDERIAALHRVVGLLATATGGAISLLAGALVALAS